MCVCVCVCVMVVVLSHGGCGWVMAVVCVMVVVGGLWWLCVGHGGCV